MSSNLARRPALTHLHLVSVGSEHGAQRLSAAAVSVHFDGVKALSDASVDLNGREILGLIGPNGAGKTTMVNVLTGFQRPTAGAVSINGVDIAGLEPYQVSRLGVGRTFQAARLFKDLSVEQNLQASSFGAGASDAEARKLCEELLEFLSIQPIAKRRAGELSYGDSRRVGIGRALASRPKFILMDEPAAGMSEPECDDLARVINAIPERFGCGIMLIEHNLSLVMQVCERISVLDSGRVLATGSPSEIRNNAAVRAAYLGLEAT
jgi:branched-chain amino acid transport system ATP-binding protein